MSQAWAILVGKVPDDLLELMSEALQEVQKETSRRNTACIRRFLDNTASLGPDRNNWWSGVEAAADLIDPDKE